MRASFLYPPRFRNALSCGVRQWPRGCLTAFVTRAFSLGPPLHLSAMLLLNFNMMLAHKTFEDPVRPGIFRRYRFSKKFESRCSVVAFQLGCRRHLGPLFF